MEWWDGGERNEGGEPLPSWPCPPQPNVNTWPESVRACVCVYRNNSVPSSLFHLLFIATQWLAPLAISTTGCDSDRLVILITSPLNIGQKA